jgi:Protein of unknown function (DUF2637)
VSELTAPRMLRATRAAAVVITAAIGAGSFVLSFSALRDLAARAGVPRDLAWLWPLIVDGAILQATMAVVALAAFAGQRGSRRFFWTVLACAAVVSVGSNALHAVLPRSAALPPWLAALIAMVAPVSLLAATHGLSLLVRVGGSESASDVRAVAVASGRSPLAPETTEPVLEGDRARWQDMATLIVKRAVVRDASASEVADVLHLTYEREMSNRAIGRALELDHRVVGRIVSASADLLRSGRIAIGASESVV